MRVDAGSCGNGVGCVAGTDVESVVDEEVENTSIDEVLDVLGGSVLEEMPSNAVVVAESRRSGVAMLRRAMRAG